MFARSTSPAARNSSGRKGDSPLLLEEARGILGEDLAARVVGQVESEERLDVLPQVGHTRRRPVAPPKATIGDLGEARHEMEQALRRDPREVEGETRVPAHEEERRVAGERPSGARGEPGAG